MITLFLAVSMAAFTTWLAVPRGLSRLQIPARRAQPLVDRWARRGRPRAAARSRPAELPIALDFLAACLEVGLPVSRAVGVVADLSPEATAAVLGPVAARSEAGESSVEVWEGLTGDPVWGGVARDIAGAQRWGTSVVALLRSHAEDARREQADATLRRARTVGVRSAVPLMVCFLPAFVLVGVVPIVVGLVTDLLG